MLSVKSEKRTNISNLEDYWCGMDLGNLDHIHTKALDDMFWLLSEKERMGTFYS